MCPQFPDRFEVVALLRDATLICCSSKSRPFSLLWLQFLDEHLAVQLQQTLNPAAINRGALRAKGMSA